jgi:peptidoglycan/xylan/chitin deacetylase (PgdA/CDA1 family)
MGMGRLFSFVLLLALSPLANCQPAREVAITVDDLPRGGDAAGTPESNYAMTVKFLAPFQREKIPLIGFVNECQYTPELGTLLPLWVAAGAELGNHTCSHPDLNKTSAADFEAEIANGEKATTAALGHRPVYSAIRFCTQAKTRKPNKRYKTFCWRTATAMLR